MPRTCKLPIIGPDFTFSMDTRSMAASPVIKKKASPSTLRRNARRREEYLQRKQNPSPVNSTEEVETVSNALSCDQCDYKPASEKGLLQHKRKKHKPSQPKAWDKVLKVQRASLSPPYWTSAGWSAASTRAPKEYTQFRLALKSLQTA